MASPDITGRRFGRFVVLGRHSQDRWGYWRWLCRCDCGREKDVAGAELKKGSTKSCGCLRKEAPFPTWLVKHGESYSREYACWRSMWDRCTNPKINGYQYYGARGISVCDRWKVFENFLADMGRRPSPRHSIDRKDNNGDYEPSNCRWATASEQQRNKGPYRPRRPRAIA